MPAPENAPDPVEIVEVAPRDGLQNEKMPVSTDDKIELIERVIAAGARRIEATSFINPRRVPQMADAEAVMAAFAGRQDVSLIGLLLNRRGLDRAFAAGVAEVNYVICATDTFSTRNQGMATAESLRQWRDVARDAKHAGMPVSASIAVAFGCPFEGELPLSRLEEVIRETVDAGPDELALADTIGVAAPGDVTERVALARRLAPGVPLRLHFHNTRNTGIANAYAAILAGVRVLDASLGGIGGCPFAPAATGNIATEDLAYMLERMGHRTGLDLGALIRHAEWLSRCLGKPVPALLGRAGLFPAPGIAA